MSTTTEYPPLSPYLTVKDARKAIEFYVAAFGAKEIFRLNDSASGSIGHAEILINGSLVMLSEENPGWETARPKRSAARP